MNLICKICGNSIKNYLSLASHIWHKHRMRSKEYYDKFLKKEGEELCKNFGCNKQAKFQSLKIGYSKHCSYKCSALDFTTQFRRKQTLIINYGEASLGSKEIIEKRRKTCLSRYGVECVLQLPRIQEKSKQTCKKRYGVEYAFQSQIVQEKYKNTCREKYGVDNVFQLEEIQEKIIQTNLQRYGVEYPMQSKRIRESSRQTCIKKYDVEYTGQRQEHIDYMKDGGAVYANSFVKNPSWPQVKTYENTKELYPEAVLNYMVHVRKGKWYSLDIAILSLKIDIEYDGSRYHQDIEYDRKRDECLKSLGWVVLRYRDRVPSKEEILKDILGIMGENNGQS